MARSAVVFEDELPAPAHAGGGNKGAWVERLEKAGLKRRRGKWARIMECDTQDKASNTARNITHKRVLLPSGKWEAASRTVDGKYFVFVRYMGPDGA